MESTLEDKKQKIREQITPKGDGNELSPESIEVGNLRIREQITPKGDGNSEKTLCMKMKVCSELENR